MQIGILLKPEMKDLYLRTICELLDKWGVDYAIHRSKKEIRLYHLDIKIVLMYNNFRDILGTYSDVLFKDAYVLAIQGMTYDDLFFRSGKLKTIDVESIDKLWEVIACQMYVKYAKNTKQQKI